ncbi:hypothetical protein STRAU_6760 [Streptomyces aurantiacus JA 4570]|uniref:Uncharacterized protein n=1 Tax=Streptomyces aurantiacus JA 4570 TaxID=1286094 RepID=S3Z8Z7_9ACTN|nr:hypothetical protein STRAU_6760 [Streptomyces aurantiacus JA 4570]
MLSRPPQRSHSARISSFTSSAVRADRRLSEAGFVAIL